MTKAELVAAVSFGRVLKTWWLFHRSDPPFCAGAGDYRGLLGPILLFLFHRDVEFDWIEAYYFKLRTAIRALDNVSLVRFFIDLNFCITFGAGPSRHVLRPSRIPAKGSTSKKFRRDSTKKYLTESQRFCKKQLIKHNL